MQWQALNLCNMHAGVFMDLLQGTVLNRCSSSNRGVLARLKGGTSWPAAAAAQSTLRNQQCALTSAAPPGRQPKRFIVSTCGLAHDDASNMLMAPETEVSCPPTWVHGASSRVDAEHDWSAQQV